ncbi:unnamed protein product [Owenia fusiformis]|uniref:Uncharacterized protein n=1 Tax=Owenia fusiformis TaxID=6347 RepID=A0A8J1XJI7_OWEFU|nr:unnamed protein product [Owenia fusiformis]
MVGNLRPHRKVYCLDRPNETDRGTNIRKQASMTSQNDLISKSGESLTQFMTNTKEGDTLRMLNPTDRELLRLVNEGDMQDIKEYVEHAHELDINCHDFMGRSALTIAIQHGHEELVDYLLHQKDIKLGDSLLHAVKEGNITIVEMLLNWGKSLSEAERRRLNEDFSESAEFPPGVTPLVLACHYDNYDIIQLLLSNGGKIDDPHDFDCQCQECKRDGDEFGEFLETSRKRINTYRALASPGYICQTSDDPMLVAFKLAHGFDKLYVHEPVFRKEYKSLADQCREFAVDLLDQCRASEEVYHILRRPEGAESREGARAREFPRLHLAIEYEMKDFIVHPNCQQVIQTLWTEYVPDFMRRSMLEQIWYFTWRLVLLPVMILLYLVAPKASFMKSMRSPMNKFLSDTASYVAFLGLLFANMMTTETRKRGQHPGDAIEWLIIVWVVGLLWNHAKVLWGQGRVAYFKTLWHIYDIVMIGTFVLTFVCWAISYTWVRIAGTSYADELRRFWFAEDPILLAEGFFSIGTVLAFGRIVYLFQMSQILGPLQISLSRMLDDILQILLTFLLTMFCFASGLTRLYSYYENSVRVNPNNSTKTQPPQFVEFSNTFRTLFWNLFGYGEPEYADIVVTNTFNNTLIVPMRKHHFTEGVGYLLYAGYHVIVVTVLLNMLIAMMSNSLNEIQENADVEWKFARSRMWMTYFESGGTLPPPFNLIPSPKSFFYLFLWIKTKCCGSDGKTAEFSPTRCCYLETEEDTTDKAVATQRHKSLMVQLVLRYFNKKEQEKVKEAVTPDDLDSLRQDLLREIQKLHPPKTPKLQEISSNQFSYRSPPVQPVQSMVYM